MFSWLQKALLFISILFLSVKKSIAQKNTIIPQSQTNELFDQYKNTRLKTNVYGPPPKLEEIEKKRQEDYNEPPYPKKYIKDGVENLFIKTLKYKKETPFEKYQQAKMPYQNIDTSYFEFDTAYAYLRHWHFGVSLGLENEFPMIEMEQGIGIAHSFLIKASLLNYDSEIKNAYLQATGNKDFSSAYYPHLSIAYRYYYNFKKRIAQQKSVYKRSGSFIALESYVLAPAILTYNQDKKNTLLNPQWGIYLYWGKQFCIGRGGVNLEIGPMLYFNEIGTEKRFSASKTSDYLRYPLRASVSFFYAL